MGQATIRGLGLLAILLACAPAVWAASAAVTDAQTLVNQGKFEQALQTLDRHIKVAPQDAEALFTRGLVLVRLDRIDDAIKAFTGMTRDFPQLPEPHNNLAVLYAQQGEYEKARDSLEAALATHPSYTVAHENLGDIYAALAAAAYNRALTLDQNNPSVRAKLNLINQLDSLGDGRAVATRAPAATAKAPAQTTAQAPAQAAAPAKTPAPAPAAAAPAATPKPAGPTTPAKPAPDTVALEKTVLDWAAAWSSRDADRYLSFYAPGFDPEGNMSHDAWEALRRERVTRPSSIVVAVSGLKFDPIAENRVRAEFRQDYTSDTFSNQATKVLELTSTANGWKIAREYTR